MKQFFQQKKFNAEAEAIVDLSIQIVEAYRRLGYRLSLRQLYYQLVSRNAVPNTEKSYNKVGVIIADARLAGLIDWDMIVIEDRNRGTIIPAHWDNPAQIIEAAVHSYRLDKWLDQPSYCEVMVEKQALEGVLEPVCRELDIPFTSNKGYSSVTMMHHTGQKLKELFRNKAKKKGLWVNKWNLSKRMNMTAAQALHKADRIDPVGGWKLNQAGIEAGWPRIVVFYLGDHDPSGMDMTRDVADRLRMFSDWTPIEVRRLALNIDQVRELQPPENPAKVTDSRAKKYIERFGRSSWELDAVEPTALAQMVRTAILSVRDEEMWAASVRREEYERGLLKNILTDLKKKIVWS